MLAATLREKTMPVKKTKEHPDGLSQKPKSRDDYFASSVHVTGTFMAERERPKNQERGVNDDSMGECSELREDDRAAQ